MKKSGFRKLTREEAIAKQAARNAKARERAKIAKAGKKRSTGILGAKKRKVQSTSTLKKKLDAIFSKYIRQIHPATCYTCGKRSTRKKLQCGHFVSRQYLATRWEKDNCRPQCWGCNGYGNGRLLDFEERLKKELGEKRVEELKASRHKIIKLDSLWYEAKLKEYTTLYENLS